MRSRGITAEAQSEMRLKSRGWEEIENSCFQQRINPETWEDTRISWSSDRTWVYCFIALSAQCKTNRFVLYLRLPVHILFCFSFHHTHIHFHLFLFALIYILITNAKSGIEYFGGRYRVLMTWLEAHGAHQSDNSHMRTRDRENRLINDIDDQVH